MGIYIFLLSLFLFPHLFCRFRGIKVVDKEIYVSSFGILLCGVILCFLLSGFRWYTGTDWESYWFYFRDNYSFSDFNDGTFEIGWTILSYLVKNISFSYTVWLLFFHFLILYITVNAIQKLKKTDSFDLFVFAILYFCSHKGDLFATRQMLACAILFNATIDLLQEKKCPFYIKLFFAVSIHISSIIFIIAPLLMRIRISKSGLIFIFFLFIVTLVFSIKIWGFIFIKLTSAFGRGRVFGKLISYQHNKNSISVVYIIRYLLFIPFIFSVYKIQTETYKSLFIVYLFGSFFFIFSSMIMDVLARFALYFTNFEALLLSMYVTKLKKYRLVIELFIIAYAILKYITYFYGEYNDLFIPYYSIFNYQIRGY